MPKVKYELACRKALEFLNNCACHEIKDARNQEEVVKAVKTAVMSKQYGHEDFLADLIVRACTAIGMLLVWLDRALVRRGSTGS